MALRLQVTSAHQRSLGEARTRQFAACGGTIGRAEDNDWVLPDDKRFISSRHALIDFQSGAYYLVDMSRNGVYVNGADTAVGRGHPQRLFNGDRLRMGEYEISVEITAGDEALADDGMRDSVVRAQLVPVDESVEVPLVAEKTMRGFDYDALERHLAPAADESSIKSGKSLAGGARPGKSTSTGEESHAAPANGSAALDIFCKAAGLQPDDLPGRDPEQMLEAAGALTRELLTGLGDLLHNPLRMKDALRQAQSGSRSTPGHPARRSPDASNALKLLVGPPGTARAHAAHALPAAFQSVRGQQQALLKAMIHALRDFAERLEPGELRDQFDRGLKRSALLASANKLKYWELYEEAYLEITRQDAGAPLPAVVIDALTKAYEQELEAVQQETARPAITRSAQAS